MAKDNKPKRLPVTSQGKVSKADIDAFLKKWEAAKARDDKKKMQACIRQFVYCLRFINRLFKKSLNLQGDFIDIPAVLAGAYKDDEDALKYALNFQMNSTHIGHFESIYCKMFDSNMWIRICFNEVPAEKDEK